MGSSVSENLDALRHSSSHVLAEAVQALYPDVKLAIGPSIADGFYYDFDLPVTLTESELPRIEEKMREIIRRDLPFEQSFMERAEALAFFKKRGEPYKCELIEELPAGEKISLFKSGAFTDLCRGPHVCSTGKITAFKLLAVAGAYWRGSEKNKMLTRVYGTAFPDPKALEAHLVKLEEARRRDHRRLGRELELFSFQEELGSGLVLWHPKGAVLRSVIEDYWKKEHEAAGYRYVYSPHIARLHLWETSGHTSFYRESMFAPMKVEEEQYQIKPMNCPFHILIYQTKTRSYRELPLRYSELGTVYRYERSGTMHGLLRVRGFTQDDAHIFCTPDQLKGEVKGVLELAFRILDTFGFRDYEIHLSAHDPKDRGKYAGTDEEWERAETALSECLREEGREFVRAPGEAVFYGPKIDIKILDSLHRPWQCTTVQFDFNLPRRFNVRYVDNTGAEQYPFLVHRALFGSLERFIGTLIEHYGGAFPVWLAPVQAVIASISEHQEAYAREVQRELTQAGLRAELDVRPEKIGYKVREAELMKVPFVLVVGDREAASRSVNVRGRGRRDLGTKQLQDFIAEVTAKVRNKEKGDS